MCIAAIAPAYAVAGAELLNRDLPAEYKQDWTEHFALEKRRIIPGKLSVVYFPNRFRMAGTAHVRNFRK